VLRRVATHVRPRRKNSIAEPTGFTIIAGMANTYSALYYHIVFSTKNRQNWIHRDIEATVWAYLGGIARAHGFALLCAGGIENHLHLLVKLPPNLALSKAVQSLKGGSSAWMKITFPKISGIRDFAWRTVTPPSR